MKSGSLSFFFFLLLALDDKWFPRTIRLNKEIDNRKKETNRRREEERKNFQSLIVLTYANDLASHPSCPGQTGYRIFLFHPSTS